MSIIRGTTHDLEFDFTGVDFSAVSVLKITFKQFLHEVTTKEIEDVEVDGDKVFVRLSQEDTLNMIPNRHIKIQARLFADDGRALATDKVVDFVEDVEKDGVIGNEDNI